MTPKPHCLIHYIRYLSFRLPRLRLILLPLYFGATLLIHGF